MKKTVSRLLLLLTIFFATVTPVLFIGSMVDLFSLGRQWDALLFHLPGVTFFFWQLYACRTGKRRFTRKLPLLISIGGIVLGLLLMFIFSYNPLGGFLVLLLSALHAAGAFLAVILHSIVRLFCRSSADDPAVSTISDDT